LIDALLHGIKLLLHCRRDLLSGAVCGQLSAVAVLGPHWGDRDGQCHYKQQDRNASAMRGQKLRHLLLKVNQRPVPSQGIAVIGCIHLAN
jgi:hypothetical protein